MRRGERPDHDTEMNSKQRIHAALEGKPVDRWPVTSLYSFLYHLDHFSELTGLPAWRAAWWLAAPPDEHAAVFAQLHQGAPLELLQPQHDAPPRAWRERQTLVERDGHPWRHDRATGEYERLDLPTRSGHATDYRANETQFVFDARDAAEQVMVTPAGRLLADGANDYIDAVVARFGREEFIVSGGVLGTLYACHAYVGLTNLYAMLVEEPALIDELSRRILEQNIEIIRRLAAAGGDAIYIDDAMTTSDMISAAHYERFCQPHIKAMVDEIHRLGHKAIVIYFGGIADRLDAIAGTGADGLACETSMKGYVNDIGRFAEGIGGRITLFGNIDPVGVLQDAGDAELEAEVLRQIAAGGRARGFISCTGSPITPATPASRVRRFIELARRHGRMAA
jgi:hypothetical protein